MFCCWVSVTALERSQWAPCSCSHSAWLWPARCCWGTVMHIILDIKISFLFWIALGNQLFLCRHLTGHFAAAVCHMTKWTPNLIWSIQTFPSVVVIFWHLLPNLSGPTEDSWISFYQKICFWSYIKAFPNRVREAEEKRGCAFWPENLPICRLHQSWGCPRLCWRQCPMNVGEHTLCSAR